MSATVHSGSVEQGPHPREAAAPGPSGGGVRLQWLIRRIAADDRGAFAELCDRLSGPLSCGVRRQVSDPQRVAGVLAGTLVEVWWLAGAHVDPHSDVVGWINEIVRRRIADSRPPLPDSNPPDPNLPDPDLLGTLWAQAAEAELAGLLGRSDPARYPAP